MVKEPLNKDLDPRMEILRDYLLAKPGVTDDFPFGPEVMVFRVAGKIFAFLPWELNPVSISLKCDPERATELREMYPGITGAYHLDKKHWNGVLLDDAVTMDLVEELMDHSYDLVFAKLPKKVRDGLA